LGDEILGRVVRLQLERIQQRVLRNHAIPLSYNNEVVELIISRCTELESGARMVEAILSNNLLPEISRHLLTQRMGDRQVAAIHVGVEEGEFQFSFDKPSVPTVLAQEHKLEERQSS
jgi:type VI secretion system protein VasG